MLWACGRGECDDNAARESSRPLEKRGERDLALGYEGPASWFRDGNGCGGDAGLEGSQGFVTVLGSDDERKASMDVLKSAQRFVRQSLGRRVSMKVLPEIEFEYDTSVDKSIRMQELLEQIDRGGESGQNGATGQNGPVGDNNEADADEQG